MSKEQLNIPQSLIEHIEEEPKKYWRSGMMLRNQEWKLRKTNPRSPMTKSPYIETPAEPPKLVCRPCELADANAFISDHHRHHKKVQGHRFSLAAWSGGRLVGVAVVGRPVARNTDQRMVLEVTRLCTDGTRNACSFLYARAASVGKAMGYMTIQTFILQSELGTSLRAAGWKIGNVSAGGTWNRPSRKGRRDDQPHEPKMRYYKDLR